MPTEFAYSLVSALLKARFPEASGSERLPALPIHFKGHLRVAFVVSGVRYTDRRRSGSSRRYSLPAEFQRQQITGSGCLVGLLAQEGAQKGRGISQ
ncbi:hypothetical protein D3C81_1901590 [compost metagenome]